MSKELGENIRRARLRSGLSATELATAIGKRAQTLTTWERGEREPNAVTLVDLAKALNTTCDELLGRSQIHAVREDGTVQGRFTAAEMREINSFIDYIIYKREKKNEQ